MPSRALDSFNSRATLKSGGASYEIRRLSALDKAGHGPIARLPWCLRILLENLLRLEDGDTVRKEDILALAAWDPKKPSGREISFTPARVLLQDFTGVPAVVDLAAMRDAITRMGGDPQKINPLQPADLVIDHSVQVDRFGSPDALRQNAELEFGRNRERYLFLRWGQQAFRNFRVVPPDTGIVHQVNLEYLARVVFTAPAHGGRPAQAYPDTLVGTDSHTTMINGLGVLGWGVGGIEAEAAMLGQPIPMLIPEVAGFQLTGALREGSTATDLVLTVTQMLRARGVVGKFVEFFGSGLDSLSLPDRATIANMAPEYGATIGFFPVDAETIRYLKLSGRTEAAALTEAWFSEQGMLLTAGAPQPDYSDTLTLDLGTVESSLAGPRRPQDRVALSQVKESFRTAATAMIKERDPSVKTDLPWEQRRSPVAVTLNSHAATLQHGSVVIAAITSCTNTSNPSVMVAAGLLAKKAVARGLKPKPWVKTSLAPGSKVVTEYLRASGLLSALEALKFHVVGYGCTTCIGNSGPLPEPIATAIRKNNLVAAAVLSGNRNFEGRINPHVRANYLASPPLVVAYALAGDMDRDLVTEPLGEGDGGKPVFLRDIWPTAQEVRDTLRSAIAPEMFTSQYAEAFAGDDAWRSLPTPGGASYSWAESTYIKNPPFFDQMPATPAAPGDIHDARVLALLGDSVTTDHISPAGSIPEDGPAGRWLIAQGVKPADFNSFGARRGNHEVMMRGTFANIRLRNRLAPGTEGGQTLHLPDGAPMTIFDAAMKYRDEKTPLLVIAGKEYGTGSSRDWAAKGTLLLGVRAVIAESFERIHRSNLGGMGVLPLQFEPGQSAASLGLAGGEVYSITGIAAGIQPGMRVQVTADSGGAPARKFQAPARKFQAPARRFQAIVRLDTPREVEYYRHGGILMYVLRSLVAQA